ncbi:MAG: hypothetical protein JWN70_2676 [Planctomycetaceae bacterium]|nr:hypothetical protein [Planctomycetaceae bacterium]
MPDVFDSPYSLAFCTLVIGSGLASQLEGAHGIGGVPERQGIPDLVQNSAIPGAPILLDFAMPQNWVVGSGFVRTGVGYQVPSPVLRSSRPGRCDIFRW